MILMEFWTIENSLLYSWEQAKKNITDSTLGFLVYKKYTLTLLWDENFFSLIRSNGVSKNPSFHTDFKNVHMTLVKSAPKKSFAQKTDFFRTFNS